MTTNQQTVSAAETRAPKIRLHDTRHTMATLALEAGVHPKVVQEQLGHSANAVTMDTLSHVPQAVKRDSAEKIASVYEGNQRPQPGFSR